MDTKGRLTVLKYRDEINSLCDGRMVARLTPKALLTDLPQPAG